MRGLHRLQRFRQLPVRVRHVFLSQYNTCKGLRVLETYWAVPHLTGTKENKFMKRILLFLATNIAVMLVLSVVVSVLGLDRWLMADGIDYVSLLWFSAIFGFGGAFISLLLSKTIAKWSTGAQ